MLFLTLQTSLHHPSKIASACCLSLLPLHSFPPLTQHHGTFFPKAIQTTWLLTDHSMNDFDYSHTHTPTPPPHTRTCTRTHTYTPSLSHRYLVLSSPNSLFSLSNKLSILICHPPSDSYPYITFPLWLLSYHIKFLRSCCLWLLSLTFPLQHFFQLMFKLLVTLPDGHPFPSLSKHKKI